MGLHTHMESMLVALDLAYQEEMRSTPAGREAYAWILEAQELEHRSQFDEALALRQQAVALFPEEDDGAAASSARHDLAHSLTPNPRHGLLKGQLMADWQACISAIELFRQALRSPARQRVPMRRAQSENSLAVCLRALAGMVKPQEREELLREAEQLYRSVITLTEKCGRWGSRLMAEAHLNLGNLLLEREDDAQALRQYEWAIGAALRAERDGNGSLRHVLARARLSAAGILLRRGRRKDLKTAEQYATEAMNEPEPGREDQALLVLAELALAGEEIPERRARAKAYLSKVRSARLEDDRLRIVYVQLLRRTGAVEDALAVLRDWIEQSIHLRAQTIADFAADTAAMDFQVAASLAARILVEDKADALGAFLQLENTSGMRFAEAFSVFSWRPQEPVARALYSKLEVHSARASVLDSMVRSMETLAPEGQRERLQNLRENFQSAPDDTEGVRGMPDKAFYVETLQAALNANVPLHHLERCLEEDRMRCLRLKSALRRRDATYRERSRSLEEDLSPEELTELLREHPEQVLVRLSLQKELLVVATWLEGEQVVARSASIALPSALRILLHKVAQDSKEVDYVTLTELLASVDLSAALPTKRYARAVLLPSHAAAALPLAALGPMGNRLVDRFESLIWLPSLLPLRTWPAAMKPRAGHLVVNPLNTVFHAIALPSRRDGERRLEGGEATPEALMRAAAEVETLSIYTHGRHRPGDEPVLELHDKQPLPASHLMGKLAGLERMEIWACQTGTNRATDPFTPPVDEGFGLDFLLLSNGVRTVIGTLWSVPDLVTASIVRHYRQRISEGVDPAVALLEAQRWWQAEGLPLLLEQLQRSPTKKAVADFAAKLGVELAPDALDSATRMLGPGSQVEKVRAAFSCPVTWAALRFVGVPERGPRQPWVEVPERPLTEEEAQEVARCLEVEPSETAEPEEFRQLQESWLTERAPLHPGEAPSAEEALQVARMLRDRLIGSHPHNLLTALAWLHEVIAAPELAEADRVKLSVEAAHLWLEVALVEQWPPFLPQQTAVARARRLLERLPPAGETATADVLAARARLHVLLHAYDSDEPLRCIQEAWELLSPALGQLQSGTYEALRVATVAVELLPRAEVGVASQRERTLQCARTLAEEDLPSGWLLPAWQRLCGALDRFQPDARNAHRAQQLSTPRELMEATFRAVEREAQGPAPSSVATLKHISEALSQMESGLWGHPSDDRWMLVRTTGTLGAAYRALMKTYLSNHIRNEPESGGHQLACLQYACDLRLAFLGRLAWASAWMPGEWGALFRGLHEFIRRRQSLSAALADTALLEDVLSGEKPSPPHELDPYALPARAMSPGLKDARGLSAWSLELLCTRWPQRVTPARTAAFEAVRMLSALEHDARELWRQALELDTTMRRDSGADDSAGLPRLLDPGLKLESNEAWLGKLAEGYGLFGLLFGQEDELFVVAWWNAGAGPTGRTVRLSAREVKGALLDLLRPAKEDLSPRRGSTPARREAWNRLEAALSPVFTSLLKQAQQKRSLRWWVLAPGALRSLPLLGLRLEDGELLAEKVTRLSHLPSLGFGLLGGAEQQAGAPFTACLLPPESQQGTTCFGEAALETLHGVYPPELAVDPGRVQARGGDVVELLAPRAARVQTLRLYGVGTPLSLNGTMGSLRLGPGHSLMERNTIDLFLPRCRVVELWACTAGSAGTEQVIRDHEDRLPGLVPGFLASGAAAVIDLAWPVHDVVKALVCEQYGWRSRRTAHGPEILAESIENVALLLRELRELPASATRREVLAAIDEMRQLLAGQVLGKPPALAPFEAHVDSPAVAGLSGAELIAELCQPVHLGAFRWWGE